MQFEIQKAGMGKRAGAFMVDMILTVILAYLLMTLLTNVTGYNRKAEEMQSVYRRYCEEAGLAPELTEAEFEALPQEVQAKYQAVSEAMDEDEAAVALLNQTVRLSLLCLTLSIFIPFVIFEFVIPLFMKEGRTLGKRIFGLCVVHLNGVRMEPFSVFVRGMIGKFAIETMVPVLILVQMYYNAGSIVGAAVVLVLLAVQIILLIATGNNQALHDILPQCAVVDYQSQVIYATYEDMKAAQGEKIGRAAKGAE